MDAKKESVTRKPRNIYNVKLPKGFEVEKIFVQQKVTPPPPPLLSNEGYKNYLDHLEKKQSKCCSIGVEISAYVLLTMGSCLFGYVIAMIQLKR